MRNRLDAARFKLSTATPDMPLREIQRIISQLARSCTSDDLANLLTEALDAEQQARKELALAQARLTVLNKARITLNINQQTGQ